MKKPLGKIVFAAVLGFGMIAFTTTSSASNSLHPTAKGPECRINGSYCESDASCCSGTCNTVNGKGRCRK